MNQKYKATGIVLKGSPLKESDRLVTVLTSEYGLVRAVAPGAKKHKSQLRGRTELFVTNEFLIIKGRSLDKIIQADTIYTYPGLSRDLGKLATAQYLAELSLSLALSEQPQTELYELLNEHLQRLEKLDRQQSVYPNLTQAAFHLLAIAGIAPEVYNCCLTQKPIAPDFNNPRWRVGFSFNSGGAIDLAVKKPDTQNVQNYNNKDSELSEENTDDYYPTINYKINSIELTILQLLNNNSLPLTELTAWEKTLNISLETTWMRVEKILREYIQYQLGKPIRSAALVDNLYVEF
ncbi:DNA repair protein RecO [Myxosarcina sp. GI1]|uniref:DNA repair protein RecO n=1 Tax=Myxosarcina sp. GI1 TaxID=1541065 RepID=UPI00056D7310|nr:DNA repair protein RecO [Myxosarcina sp. GI1]